MEIAKKGNKYEVNTGPDEKRPSIWEGVLASMEKEGSGEVKTATVELPGGDSLVILSEDSSSLFEADGETYKELPEGATVRLSPSSQAGR